MMFVERRYTRFGEATNQAMIALPRSFYIALAVAAVEFSVACNSKEPPPVRHIDPHEHVETSPIGTTQKVLDKTFTLKKSETYAFEIPAHAASPHLHGIFEAFVHGGPTTSDEAANIDFMILNEEQQAAVLANHAADTVLTVEDSHNQAVNCDLPPSLDQPVKYYLVFRNPDGGKTSKVIRASFRVDF
jgi:hypothetical protein